MLLERYVESFLLVDPKEDIKISVEVPELEGSEKQIKWANDIREDLFINYVETMGLYLKEQAEYKTNKEVIEEGRRLYDAGNKEESTKYVIEKLGNWERVRYAVETLEDLEERQKLMGKYLKEVKETLETTDKARIYIDNRYKYKVDGMVYLKKL